MIWVTGNLKDWLLEINDPNNCLSEDDEGWISNCRSGDSRPDLIFECKSSKIRITVNYNGYWNKIEIHGSNNINDAWTKIFEKVHYKSGTETYEIETPYNYLKFHLSDGNSDREFIKLYKSFEYYYQPCPCDIITQIMNASDEINPNHVFQAFNKGASQECLEYIDSNIGKLASEVFPECFIVKIEIKTTPDKAKIYVDNQYVGGT